MSAKRSKKRPKLKKINVKPFQMQLFSVGDKSSVISKGDMVISLPWAAVEHPHHRRSYWGQCKVDKWFYVR